MQSQIQCPVCTLYLHVGMNLQVHLDTHPKDQVITALVNFTLLKQNNNDNVDVDDGRFECTTYAPLASTNDDSEECIYSAAGDQQQNIENFYEHYDMPANHSSSYSGIIKNTTIEKQSTIIGHTTNVTQYQLPMSQQSSTPPPPQYPNNKPLRNYQDLPPPPPYDVCNSALRSRSVLRKSWDKNQQNNASISGISHPSTRKTNDSNIQQNQNHNINIDKQSKQNQQLGICANVNEINRPVSVIQLNNVLPEKSLKISTPTISRPETIILNTPLIQTPPAITQTSFPTESVTMSPISAPLTPLSTIDTETKPMVLKSPINHTSPVITQISSPAAFVNMSPMSATPTPQATIHAGTEPMVLKSPLNHTSPVITQMSPPTPLTIQTSGCESLVLKSPLKYTSSSDLPQLPPVITQPSLPSSIIQSCRPIIQKKSGLRILSDVTLNPNENLLMSDLIYDTITLSDVFLNHSNTTTTSESSIVNDDSTAIFDDSTLSADEDTPENSNDIKSNNDASTQSQNFVMNESIVKFKQMEIDEEKLDSKDFEFMDVPIEMHIEIMDGLNDEKFNKIKNDVEELMVNETTNQSISVICRTEKTVSIATAPIINEIKEENLEIMTTASAISSIIAPIISATTSTVASISNVEAIITTSTEAISTIKAIPSKSMTSTIGTIATTSAIVNSVIATSEFPISTTPIATTSAKALEFDNKPMSEPPIEIAQSQAEDLVDQQLLIPMRVVTKRPLLKKPFVKKPKRIVVKFKKPITNYPTTSQSSETSGFSSSNQIASDYFNDTTTLPVLIKSEPAIDIPFEGKSEIIEPNLDCAAIQPEIETKQSYVADEITDVAFSPFRDSFTPTLPLLEEDFPTPIDNFQQNNTKYEKDLLVLEGSPEFIDENKPDETDMSILNEQMDSVTECIGYSIKILDDDNANVMAETICKSAIDIPDLSIDEQHIVASQEPWPKTQTSHDQSNEKSPIENNENQSLDQEEKISDYASPSTSISLLASSSTLSTSLSMSSSSSSSSLSTSTSTTTTTVSDSFTVLAQPQTSTMVSLSSALSSSSSLSTSTNNSNNQYNTPGPSREDYSGLTSFFGYNDPTGGGADGDDFYSSVPLSPIGYSPENYLWNQKYSPSYVPFDSEKNSYMDLDLCKNTNTNSTTTNCERAPSADSLNIRTDEKMPAKGEISEQESNGDIEGSWSHQIFPLQDALPKYTSSYDTTVARESWSLSNEQNVLPQNLGNLSTVLPIFTPLRPSVTDNDVKPDIGQLQNNIDKSKSQRSRRYRCPECPQIFSILKEKRRHMVDVHNYQQTACRKSKVTATATNANNLNGMSTSTDDVDGNGQITMANSFLGVKIKPETSSEVERIRNMNQHLLTANWTVLRQKLTLEDVKIPILPAENNVYLCLVCHERFYSLKTFNAHFSIHPAECYTCGRMFKHWMNFSVHLKRHLGIKEYLCIHCSKRFVLRQNLVEHMNTHTGDTPFVCKFCSKRFRRYSNLVQHRNRHHLNIRPKEKDYICQCGEVYHSLAKFVWHKETHEKKPKCCPYCRERFMHRNSLSRHVRLSHTEHFAAFNADLVECPVCNKKYIKSSLKNHLSMHSTKIIYECNICNKHFTTKWNLKQHKWIHASRSLKPYKCGVCPKAFIRETEYTSHVNTHKSIKPYTCDHCGCQFARKYNWLRHAREHEHPKKYRCDECGKEFHRAYYLTEHKRSHTGERPFECAICGKTSTTKTNHNKHVKIHHARDPLTAEG